VTTLRSGHVVRRVPFDEAYLERSAVWLQDRELQDLIRSADFDPEQQRAWYDGLSARTDYAVWGIECDGRPVGMMNIKRIGVDDGAVYQMYIGERDFWGVGIGTWALREVQQEIKARGLRWVYGRIAEHNTRSQAAHFAMGMRRVAQDGDEILVAIGVDEPVGRKPSGS
jgi:RimJ/RimL family protein N-acetyltransferase